MKVVCILSGGLDSSVLLHQLVDDDCKVLAINFKYGQTHSKETDYAFKQCKATNTPIYVVPLELPFYGTSLMGSGEIPNGHYAEESMRKTIVPNRNAIFLAIAWGVAMDIGADAVATAVHSGDHYIYPDCRPKFINKMEDGFREGSEGTDIRILTPFIGGPKSEIVRVGNKLGVDFGETWSCYKGREVHCGKCGTCNERIEAFQLAGVKDPTIYKEER